VSDILGKTILIQRNNFTDVEQKYQELNLINPDQIRTLEDNQAIFVSKNKHPQIINITPYYNNWSFNLATKKDVADIKEKPVTGHINTLKI
jgi:type IV secretion system protein VirD4